MEMKRLGNTSLEVSRLGLGGLFVSEVGGDFDQGRDAIHAALDLNINYIDTAPTYANSEQVLGKALKNVEAPLILSTKFGGRPKPFRPKDKKGLRRSFERSLQLLKRDYIDLLMIHEPDRPGQYDWWDDWDDLHGPVLEVLDELKREGLIGYAGLGGTTVYEMTRLVKTGRFDVLLTAFNYSLLWREAALELIPAAKELGMGVIAGSPLQQGALARRYDAEIAQGAPWLSPPRREQFRALYALLDGIDMPLPELALRFVLSNPDVDTVLTGARSKDEVLRNAAAAERGALPKNLLKKLERVAAMVPFRPYEEPFCLPFNHDYRGPGSAL
jgi:aryl-alcohol dehydrogenase-like predicted oxidoreductase